MAIQTESERDHLEERATKLLKVTEGLRKQFELSYDQADKLVDRIADGESVYAAVSSIRSELRS